MEGILIIISGFSGAGKGTIVGELVKDERYALSISMTTRSPREKKDGTMELEGVHYFFTDENRFKEMINHNELIEWAQYVGNYYGTPKEYVEKNLKAGKDVILEIEMQGALQVKKQYEDALLVFITAPTACAIKERLINRGTEDMATIQKRLQKSYTEIDTIDDYDYILVNDGLEETVEHLKGIVLSEHERVKRNKDLKLRLKQEFEELLKGE